MEKKLTRLGLIIAVFGLAFFVAAGYAFVKTSEGQRALNAFSAAQGVKLAYNDQGQLLDHGDAASGATILALLKNDWGYAVDAAELNPSDPVVNTASEYMVQMATIAHHTLDSTVKVTLTEDATTADG